MLGRNAYEPHELAHARAVVKKQLADWRSAGADGDLEATYFNVLVLALDRPFVHRIRKMTGKDTNPLSEVEMLVESLLDNDGVLREIKVIRYDPDKSVLGLQIGDRIALTADDFEELSAAFLKDVEQKSA